jgi:hypothetical protein
MGVVRYYVGILSTLCMYLSKCGEGAGGGVTFLPFFAPPSVATYLGRYVCLIIPYAAHKHIFDEQNKLGLLGNQTKPLTRR